MNFSIVAPLALCAAMAGCAAMNPPPPPTVAQILNDDPTAQCLVTANADSRLLKLEPRVGSLRSANEATLALLTSKDMPTPEEKAMLEIWGNERQRCLGLGTAYRAINVPAALVSSFEIGQRDLVMLTARLYAGQLTYGQFNIQRQELAGAHRQKYVEFEQQMQATAPLQSNGWYLKNNGTAFPRAPVQTNCYRFGDVSWNCTSQ